MAKAKTAPEKSAPAKGAAVAKKETTAVALAKVNMEEDAGGGFEGATKDSFAIPFLAILQSGSPQCKKSEGAYIKGAEEGDVLNTVSNELFGGEDGVLVVPAAYVLSYVEWSKRENGGGFVAEHDAVGGAALARSCYKDDKGRDTLPNGNQLNQTHNFYVILVSDDGTHQPTVISMTSTQIKKAKRWMSNMNQLRKQRDDGTTYQAPMFSSLYRLKTVAESNEKGSWFGWAIERERELDATDNADVALYLEAKAFKQSIIKGEIKVTTREAEVSASSSTIDEDPDEM